MRILLRLLVLGALLASAGGALAQTVTPVASQLLPCRLGGSVKGNAAVNACGGLCPVGYECAWDNSTTNAGCTCLLEAQVCGGIGAAGGCTGACATKPDQIGGRCTGRGGACRCE